VDLAEREGLLVIEDDPYRELWFETPAPPPLYNLRPDGRVVRLRSFSKLLAPGLRLGWMEAPPALARAWTQSGLLDSGGGVNHFTAHVIAAAMDLGVVDGTIERARSVYARKCRAMLSACDQYLPDGCAWRTPTGGFFLWLRLPPGIDCDAVLVRAEAAGVSYIPGTRFHVDGGGRSCCRLSFSLLSPDELREGVRRLGLVLDAEEMASGSRLARRLQAFSRRSCPAWTPILCLARRTGAPAGTCSPLGQAGRRPHRRCGLRRGDVHGAVSAFQHAGDRR